MQLVFYLPKCETSQNQKAEVDLRQYGRHIEKSTQCHKSVADRQFGENGSRC